MITPRHPPQNPEPSGAAARASTLTGPALSENDAARLARVLKATSDPTRLQILAQLASQEEAALSVADLTQALGASQSTISHHLKILLDVRLVTRQNRGTFRYYRCVPRELNAIGYAFLRGPVAFTDRAG